MPQPHPTPWPRWRLLATLAGIAAAALVLLVGLALAVADLAVPDRVAGPPASATTPVPDGAARGDAYRDQVAAAPMLRVRAADAYTPGVATTPAEPIAIPNATAEGAAGVRTGFPRTPEGAVAQLAALEVRVFEAMSMPVTRGVHEAWVADGGPAFDAWELTGHVQSFLTRVGVTAGERDESMLLAATPAAGLVKGTDGPDWVLACVLLDVQASITADARIGYGHCARMIWSTDRWLVGPGTPPARAPSVWPGSELAVAAGWRPWTEAGSDG